MQRTPLLTITSKREGYTATVFQNEDGSCEYVGDFDVDVDGSPNWRRDPYGQPETTLQHEGRSINSDKVRGIVLPPECIKAVGPIVLGCKAEVEYRDVRVSAVVFDVGPHFKLGEGSAALANALGINNSPINGGEDAPVVKYKWWPGVPAEVDGVTYDLQPYRV